MKQKSKIETLRILNNARGFTFLEILMVMIMIGLIAAFVVPNLIGGVDKARQIDTQAQIEMLGQALDMYRLEKGKYPTNDEGLEVLRPYLKKELPKDPWGNKFHYQSPGDHGDYDLVSYGADNAEGGENNDLDIVSWKNFQ